MYDLKEYRKFTERLAQEAGSILNKSLGKVKKIRYKSRLNLTTDADTRCEQFILNRIKRAFPEDEIISEEAGRVYQREAELRWLIDPLDGTTNYAHKFGFFCVSIALQKSSETLLGVVYDPLRDETFRATKGGGAFLNGKRVRVSGIKDLKRSLLATGFPYVYGRAMKCNIENFRRFMMKAQAVRRPGSAALDLSYVACGRFDGFWEMELQPWDSAAGALLVEEAGGRVTTFNGSKFDPFKNEVVASNSKIHSQMLKVLR